MSGSHPRRTLLVATAGAVAAAGCLFDGSVGGEPSACDAVTIDRERTDPRTVQEDDVTLYEDYVVVTVTVETDDPPPLHGRIEGCDGTESVTRELSSGSQSFEFGPFGHHCVQDSEFWVEGCR